MSVTVDFTLVPLIPWSDLPALADISEPIPTEGQIISVDYLGRGDFFAALIEDDSMDQFAPAGSLLFADRRQRDLVPGKPYVIAMGSTTTIRIWQVSPERWETCSKNSAHQTLMPSDLIQTIGRIRRTVADV